MKTLNPQQLADEGQAEYQKNDYLSAAKLYEAAAEGFLAAGDTHQTAEMANNCSVSWLKAGNAQAALQAASGTEQVFEREGDTKQQACAIGNQAAALEKLQRWDEAFAAYTKSAKLLDQAGEDDLHAYVMQSISLLHLKKRHYLEAYATMRAGIMGVRKPNLKQRLLKTLIQIPYKLIK